jgi:hypothetical protein
MGGSVVKNPIRAIRERRHARHLAAIRANIPCSDETLNRMAENARRVWASLPTAAQYVGAWTTANRAAPSALNLRVRKAMEETPDAH